LDGKSGRGNGSERDWPEKPKWREDLRGEKAQESKVPALI
jgi:hypothetical protein